MNNEHQVVSGRESFLSKFCLPGKVALVTGGSHGIGRAIALTFAEAGADVVVSARKFPDLEKVAEEIKARGRKCLPVASHVAKIEDSKNLVEKAKTEFGRIDILVNIAGTNPGLFPIIDVEEWFWDVVMNTNLKGMFFLSQLVARIMKEQGGGSIINMSSSEGVKPIFGAKIGVYAVSKAAVIMLTKVMAQEWGQYNIRANAIAPGTVKTHFSEALWKGAYAEKLLKRHALGRFAETEDIVSTALYFASDASSYVTGETIVMDGGDTS